MAISSTTIQGDPSGSAAPISAASLPLPTGASTEATLSTLNGKVTTVNTGAVTISSALPAGTNVIGHVIVDSGAITANIGTTNGLALDATVSKLNIAQGAVLDSNTGPMIQGSVTTASPTYTTGQISPLSLMTTGALRIDNSSWIGSTAPTVGSKTSANSIPVVIASDQGNIPIVGIGTAGTPAGNILTVQGVGGGTALPISTSSGAFTGTVVQPTGTNLHTVVDAGTSIIGAVNLNTATANKTIVMKTGSLVTTAVTADQVVLTYTVTSGKTLYLEYFSSNAYITTLPGNTNPVLLGTASLESPAGTKLITSTRIHADYVSSVYTFSDPLPIASGTVIRCVCTPNAATSYTWRANFGGYEA